MSATIKGGYKEIVRVPTGFYLLDRAFTNDREEIGVPVGVGYEIFGSNGIGKSTFTYSLAGLLGKTLNKNIVVAALEDFDSKLLSRLLDWVGFDGTLFITDKKMDEDNLFEVIEYLHKKDYAIGIVDAIGAISTVGEQQGDIGEANMGRRALVVAQFVRKGLPLVRSDRSDKTFFMLNHWYPQLGTRGWASPGGEVKKFLLTIRVQLKREDEFVDGSYVLGGEVKKNRWGFNGRKFSAFILVGRGLHRGLTTVWDCVTLKKASYKNGIVKVGDEKIGRMSSLVKAAKEGNEEIFQPFYAALEGVEPEAGDEQDELESVLVEE